jgi:hypothetical protein
MSKIFGSKGEKLIEELRELDSEEFNIVCFSENVH